MSNKVKKDFIKRFNLIQYKFTGLEGQGVQEINAKTENQAWGKFCKMFFGDLKPNRNDWRIEQGGKHESQIIKG